MDEWAELLRAPVQLPRDPLLRHRGPGHRRQEQGDDQPLRQDPHPDQRGRQREGRPDPGVPGPVPRRGHPAHRARARPTCPATVDALRASGVKLLDTIDTYYELVDRRIPGHGEDVAELQQRKILIDGKAGELLLQIFRRTSSGPIFFEFIQRKGDEGFGEGNFKALFETIELDQMRRGVLAKS